MKYTPFAALAVAIAFAPGLAGAATVKTISGNECGRGGFGNCTAFNGVRATPTIIKFDSNFDVDDTNSAYLSVEKSDFMFTDLMFNKEGEVLSGMFTYRPGENDPGITAYAVKAGNQYNLYTDMGNAFLTGMFETPDGKGLSHITFFDTAIAPVPLPASAVLLLAGVGGLGMLRRRRQAA